MKIAVLLPCVMNENATLPSWKIAKFAAEHFDCLLIDESNIEKNIASYDILMIVNFPFLFSGKHDQIGELVRKARKIVWLSNDYTCKHPSTDNPKPKSVLRRAFGDRKDSIAWWSNRPDLAKKTGGSYVNWNIVAYRPMEESIIVEEKCVYYGSHRDDREISFAKYFGATGSENVFQVATSTRTKDKFAKYNSKLSIVPSLRPLYENLATYAGSLYIEDEDTHRNYHSPATRFYEAVSAKTALFIDRSCLATFKIAGLQISPEWIVDSSENVRNRLEGCERIRNDQARAWNKDYSAELHNMLDNAMMEL